MAGLFMCLGFPLGLLGLLGLLGFDLGSQSCIPSLPSLPSLPLLPLLLLLPSELHLGFHLESLGFDLGVPPDGSGKVFLSTSDTQIVQT